VHDKYSSVHEDKNVMVVANVDDDIATANNTSQ